MTYEKLVLSAEEQEMISSLIKQKSAGVQVIEKVIKYYLEQLRDIRNIDSKGNMGLQTLANQNAHELLLDIFNEMFPSLVAQQRAVKPKMSQWQ